MKDFALAVIAPVRYQPSIAPVANVLYTHLKIMQRPQAWLIQELRRTSLPNVVHLYALPVTLSAEVRSGIWA